MHPSNTAPSALDFTFGARGRHDMPLPGSILHDWGERGRAVHRRQPVQLLHAAGAPECIPRGLPRYFR